MRKSTHSDTRTALMQSAERLFAEKGIGTVSVKEITRAAGARNLSAVHYHFGSVEALIKEVFIERFQRIERDRLVRLAKVDTSAGENRLFDLLHAAQAPFLETCLDEDGRRYVRFCLQLASDPRFDMAQIIAEAEAVSILTLRGLVVDCLKHLPAEVLSTRLRQGFKISLMQAVEYADRVEDGSAAPIDEAIREASQTLAGYLSAPAP
ncbi:MAG: TetR/AcrR family transcriptional regulator [Pseudomonadota bacterium]